MLCCALGKKLFRLLAAGQIPVGDFFFVQRHGLIGPSLGMEQLALHVDGVHAQERIAAALQRPPAQGQQLFPVLQEHHGVIVHIVPCLIPHIVVHDSVVIGVFSVGLLGQPGIRLPVSRPEKPAVLLHEALDLLLDPGGVIAHELIDGHAEIMGQQRQ